MATDMLLVESDEVARNGAFGKILRPEVFPNAPLHTSFVSPRLHSAQFPGPPPESPPLPKRGLAGKRGGVQFSPFSCRSAEVLLEPSGQNQLLLHVDASLAQ